MSWTFLIVDSNEADAEHTARQVRAITPDAQVLVAASGGAAFTLMEERRMAPSLIFAEFLMPDMNGIEFLGKVRSRRWLEGTPVAMVTSFVDDRNVVTCYRLGACTFLTRPVPAHALRETIRDFARPDELMNAANVIQGWSTGLRRAA
ncbi:MAG: response regulator [Tepidiformaceae bacterium]